MFFTLIIPAYNCQKTIDRLLISVVNQHYDDLKVIVIDDSDENRRCQNYIDEYKHKLNIEYYIRRDDLYTCHCPGNTRHDGLRRALEEDTEYILFADCDDEFFPDSFKDVQEFLIKNDYPNAIATPFWSYNEETDQQINYEFTNVSWLHGKFYKKSFLLKNNIQFEVDLYSHEDTFFNCLIGAYFIGYQKDFLPYDKIIYKWYIRKESTSHSEKQNTDESLYFEKYFKDWIKASIVPFEIGYDKFYPENRQIYIRKIIYNLVLGYFYIQAFIYYNTNLSLLRQNYRLYKDTLMRVINKFHLFKEDIIAVAYENSQLYAINRNEGSKPLGPFIEEQSFKDFINSINIYE